jgi:hypothetical protein
MDLINEEALKDLVRTIVKEELDKNNKKEDSLTNNAGDAQIATPQPVENVKREQVIDTFAPSNPPVTVQAKPTSSVPNYTSPYPGQTTPPSPAPAVTPEPVNTTTAANNAQPSAPDTTSSSTNPTTPNPTPATPPVIKDDPSNVLDMPIG